MTFDQEEFDAIAEMESATRERSEAYTSVIKKYSRVFNEFSSSATVWLATLPNAQFLALFGLGVM